jgi:zinc transport system substrate-binding protein
LPLLLALLLCPSYVTGAVLQVFVSVLPLKDFVEQVGGKRVAVEAMVLPGHSPATYDPPPQQIAALADADLFVRAGVPFEDVWMGGIRSANPRMRILDTRAGLELRPMEGHTHRPGPGSASAGHASEQDPHVWTSPPLVKQMAARIRDALIDLDPSGAEDYERGYDAFAAKLDALDREIRSLLTDLSGRRFLVFHPAWGYFADTYGLVQVPVERGGKEPGARTLAALIEHARRDDIRVVFVQPQFGERAVLLGRIGCDRRHGLGALRPGGHTKADRQAAQERLAEVEAADLANRPIGNLSGGQLQRVLLNRALVCDPQVLILDEPTANIDQRLEGEIFDLLKRLNERMTIIVVSHDVGFISSYVTRVACINRTLVCHRTEAIDGQVIR